MDTEEFVIATARTVQVSANAMWQLLMDPPGRAPRADVTTAARWVASLDDDGRDFVRWIINKTARDVGFGVMALLDGSSSAEGVSDGIELWVKSDDGTRRQLNGPDDPLLHELYASVSPR